MYKDIKGLLENLPFELPRNELEQIFTDVSFQPQLDEVRKENRVFQFWGSNIISACYACYLFRQSKRINAAEISEQMQGNILKLMNIIHSKYHLENYLIKSNGEAGNIHPQVVARLICLVYMHYGFQRVNIFLEPLYQTIFKEPDYKTILQNHAQKQKLQPQYRVVETGGLQHECYHVVEVSVGNNTAIGEESSKKKASKEAARNYLLKYKIPLDIQKNDDKIIKKKTKHEISSSRMRELNAVMKLLDIEEKWISVSMLDTALTHKSFVNESKNKDIESNERLHVIGSHIINMLCAEFVFHEFDIAKIDFKKKCNEFLKETMARTILPDKCLDYVLQGKGNRINSNEKTRKNLLLDIQKTLIGAMWISYLEYNNECLLDKIKKFSREYFENNISNVDNVEYRGALQEISCKLGKTVKLEYNPVQGQPENNPKFECIVKIYGINGLLIDSLGIGGSKKVAAQLASKSALEKMYNSADKGEKEIFSELLGW